MADNLNILIKAILEKSSKAQLENELKNIEQKLKPIDIKANIDTKNLDKFTQTTKQIEGDFQGITEKTKEWTKALGVTVQETQKFKAGQKEAHEIIEKTITSYKEMDKIHAQALGMDEKRTAQIEKQQREMGKIHSQALTMNEKINAQITKQNQLVQTNQSKYWSQRVKETVSTMTQKPDELKQMAEYYKQLEVSSEKVAIQTHKQSLAQKDLLNQIRGVRGKDSAFISDDNLIKLDRLEKGINKLDPAHKNFSRGLNSAKSQLKDVNTDIGIYKKQVQDGAKYTNIFGQSLFEAGKKFAGWMAVATLIMMPIRAFRQGIQDLKDIDTELINIAKVTEYTKNEMKELAQTAVQVGHEFGRTAQEYLQAVTEFARAGFGQQAEEYAKLSLLLQNVGDVTATVANETLLAANAGFQLGGSYESLIGVIDKFNNISNKNATTVTKMSDAMKVGASVFHSAGMSIDETVAIIGTATASTQRAGSEISRAWRTILMNIRQVSDEEAEVTEESMKKAESALNSIGIVVRDTPSTFRPMFEIIRDLGKAWEGLSQVEQAYVSEALAGKRQSNVLIATLQNWDMAEKQLVESINASGSAMQENAIYMDSWEAKAKQLSSAMTNFWQNLINTDTIKILITSLTHIVGIFDVLVNNSFSAFAIQAGLLASTITLLSVAFDKLKLSIIGTKIGVFALDVAAKGLTATLLASPLFWTVAVSAGIIGIVKAVDALTISFKEQQEIVASLTTEINSLQTEYDQLKDTENKTELQETYLKLLEKELEILKKQNEEETKRLIRQEFFTPSWDSMGNSQSEADVIKERIVLLQQYKEELNNIEFIEGKDNSKQKQKFDDTQEKILKLEESLNSSHQSVIKYIESLEGLGSKAPQGLLELNNILSEITLHAEDYDEVIEGVTQKQEDFSRKNNLALMSTKELSDAIKDASSNIKTLQDVQKEYNENSKLSHNTIQNLIDKYPHLLAYLNDEKLFRRELAKAIEEEKDIFIEASRLKLMENEEYFNTLKTTNVEFFNWLKDEGYEKDLKNWKSLAEAKEEITHSLIKSISGMWGSYYDLEKQAVTHQYKILEAYARNNLLPENMQREYERVAGVIKQIENTRVKFDSITIQGVRANTDFSSSGTKKSSASSTPAPSEPKQLEQIFNTLQLITDKETELQKIQKERNLASENERVPLIQKEIQLQNELIKLYSNESETQKGLLQQQIETRDSLENRIEKEAQGYVKVNKELHTLELTQKYYNETSAETVDKVNELVNSHGNLNKSINSSKNAMVDAEIAVKSLSDSIDQTLAKSLDKIVSKISNDISSKIKDLNDQLKKDIESIEENIERIENSYDNIIEKKKEQLKQLDEEIDKEEYLKELRELEEEMENVLNDKRFEFITQDGKKIYTYDKNRYKELKSQREDLIKQYKNQELKNTIQKEIDDLERSKKSEVDKEKRRIDDLRRLNDRRVKDLENAKDAVTKINNDEVLSFTDKINKIKTQLNVDIGNRQSYLNQLKQLQKDELDSTKKYFDEKLILTQNKLADINEAMNPANQKSYLQLPSGQVVEVENVNGKSYAMIDGQRRPVREYFEGMGYGVSWTGKPYGGGLITLNRQEMAKNPQVPGGGKQPDIDEGLEEVKQLQKEQGGQWVYLNKDQYGKLVYWSGDTIKFSGGKGGVFQMSPEQYRALPEIDGIKVMRDYKPPTDSNNPPPSNNNGNNPPSNNTPPPSSKSWYSNWIDDKYLTDKQKADKAYAIKELGSDLDKRLLKRVKEADESKVSDIVKYAKSIGIALNYYHTGLDKGMFAGDIPFDPKTETIAKLLKGEVVMTKPQFNNIIPNIMKNMSFLNKNQAQPVKQYILNNPIIKANNPIELFNGIEHMVRSQG